ncbi:hypothetical protein H4R20_000883 [Coemansia guatemalensis]|uniref:CCHC-type domain-containing protein n=1 Tax=Coemansia guatemalensis TaxID=2761395 RepID=A0A9W8I2Z3_9FUNG|nr:hypothetical protein H4R20_000883 [Coemansia guatemalensis]
MTQDIASLLLVDMMRHFQSLRSFKAYSWDSTKMFLHTTVATSPKTDKLLDIIKKVLQSPFVMKEAVKQLIYLKTIIKEMEGVSIEHHKAYLLMCLPNAEHESIKMMLARNKTFDKFTNKDINQVECWQEDKQLLVETKQSMGLAENAYPTSKLAETASTSSSVKLDELIKKFDMMVLAVSNITNAQANAMQSRHTTHNPKCVYCTQMGHFNRNCTILSKDMSTSKVKLVNNMVCWPDGI